MNSVSYTVTRTINAPLSFVYDWCTDFREDDPKLTAAVWARLTGSTNKMKIIEKTDKRVISFKEELKEGKKNIMKNVVTLFPPDRWHLDSKGDLLDATGDYHLFSDGDGTRLEMAFKRNYKISKVPTSEDLVRINNAVWDKLISTLENEHRAQK